MSAPHKKQPAGMLPAKDNGMSNDLSDFITSKQAAELLGVARAHVNHLLAKGKLKGMKPGHDWLVYRPSIEEYFKSKAASGRPTSSEPQLKP